MAERPTSVGERVFMKNLNVISLVGLMLIATACGSQSSRDLALSTSNNTSTSPGATPTPSNNGGNIYNLPAAQQQQIQLSGNNGGAFSRTLNFSTSRTLKVKVEALSAPNMTVPGYTNWVFPYGCMRVTVTVNGSTRTSKILKVSGTQQATAECVNAPSTDTLDFSNITTGNGPVTVTFSNAEYDNCRYYNPMAYGCGMSAVWQNHQVRFNATVQVDGTYLD